MSGVGLDWYKREPAAYLMDVQGLSSKEHAVYSIIIDLLYSRGGTIPNDPKFIAGFISDMGTASIRNTLASLDENPRISITITNTEISQKRAKNEVKTKQKQSENAAKTGKKGGVLSQELRRQAIENNDLGQGYPSNAFQAEKRREEKSSKSKTLVLPKKRATRIPDDWVLSKQLGDWTVDQGYGINHIRKEAEKFKDYWIGVGGQKGCKLDWNATWRNWIRNSKERTNGAGNNTQQFDEAHKEYARRHTTGQIDTGIDESDPFAGM